MARRRKKNTWVVVPDATGRYEVQRNGRPLGSGLSEKSVQRLIQRKDPRVHRILTEEPDGYRSPARLSDFGEQPGKG